MRVLAVGRDRLFVAQRLISHITTSQISTTELGRRVADRHFYKLMIGRPERFGASLDFHASKSNNVLHKHAAFK